MKKNKIAFRIGIFISVVRDVLHSLPAVTTYTPQSGREGRPFGLLWRVKIFLRATDVCTTGMMNVNNASFYFRY